MYSHVFNSTLYQLKYSFEVTNHYLWEPIRTSNLNISNGKAFLIKIFISLNPLIKNNIFEKTYKKTYRNITPIVFWGFTEFLEIFEVKNSDVQGSF